MTGNNPSNPRQFSFGGRPSELVNVAVWKFDVQVRRNDLIEADITAYVNCADRGDAFRAFFGRYPGAKIFGTGLPLTVQVADIEIGRQLSHGEILLLAT